MKVPKHIIKLQEELKKENGVAYQKLKDKCDWEKMSQLGVLMNWGDPRKWKD